MIRSKTSDRLESGPYPSNETGDGGAIAVLIQCHSSGVNVLMADGSVYFIKNSVNYVPWYGLATANGGEVLDQGSY